MELIKSSEIRKELVPRQCLVQLHVGDDVTTFHVSADYTIGLTYDPEFATVRLVRHRTTREPMRELVYKPNVLKTGKLL